MNRTRRDFLVAGTAAILSTRLPTSRAAAKPTRPDRPSLERQLGITMSSAGQLKGRDRLSILEWPRVLRDELDLTVIDLNSDVIESHEPAYLDKVRKAAADAGCVLTNMKINRPDVDVGNSDPAVRARAVAECKRWIDASARLGLRWTRPLPLKTKPHMAGYVAAYRELADYAAERGVQMVVENYGWMSDDADAVPRLLAALGDDVAPAPDTGNWSSDEVRYAGLAKMFPRAVTCDFKARELGPAGEHAAWDLKRCFTIGWDAGFRGPWCFEHAAADRKTLLRELALLGDMLRGWMAERDDSPSPFDGKSLAGWTTTDGRPVGDGWEVADGAIHRRPGGRAGNIVTIRDFGDFDLSFEWKIARGGNSGLKYRVRSYGGSVLGLEYQIYDDATAKKKLKPRGSTGALYDLYEPNDEKTLRPVGQYNSARIVVRGDSIEHWLNGKRIVTAVVGDREWARRMAESKFADLKNFARNRYGKLMLTDHGSEVWYRNFQLKTP